MKPIPFIGSAYATRSPNYSSQRCVNWYLEGGNGKARALLVGTPGLKAPWVTLAGGAVRGLRAIDATTAIAVGGGVVYKITSAGIVTSLGSVPDDGKAAQIATDGTNYLVASGGNLYSVTLAGSTATLIKAGVSGVDYMNSRFVATQVGSDNFIWSDREDAGIPTTSTNFDALYFKATNGAPDALVAGRVARGTLVLFGTQSIEQWYYSGGLDIPFSRIDGAFFEVGCAAKDSIAELDGVFWLGGDDKGAGIVWTVSGGGAPKRVSTPPIEFAIAKWPDMSDAYAFAYNQEGHSFYVLTSVSGNETWAYDITTGEWHQRAWLHASGALHRIRPRCHMYFAGMNLVGDWENGNIYPYDLNTYSDNGNALPAIRACVALESGLEMQRNVTLQLDMDTGVGLTVGQGSNPQAMLRTSKDGGKTWSNSLWRTFGKVGEYAMRCLWHRVGGGPRMVLEITITDAVPRNVTGAYLR